MRRRLISALACGSLALGAGACKDPETSATESRVRTGRDDMGEGRRLLAAGRADQAVPLFKASAAALPQDPTPLLLLAEAQREAGNDTAAVLALRQAQSLTHDADPALKMRLVELYREEGHDDLALPVLQQMRDMRQLSDAGTLLLARIQARNGDVDGAARTIAPLRSLYPDDPESQVVEAEVLLIQGEEVKATQLMDALATAHPGLVSAHVLRARYFLNNGYPEQALGDLTGLAQDSAFQADVQELKARALNQLERFNDAEAALEPLQEAHPRDVQLMALLAEVKLNLGKASEAESLVNRALAIRPNFPRTLYVRGRAKEMQGVLEESAEDYRAALDANPNFAPALSRLWRVYQRQGKRTEATVALERLFLLNETTPDERAALAGFYADAHAHQSRARKLIDEALRREPDNAGYKEIARKLGKSGGGKTGGGTVQILRRSKH